MCLLTGLGDGGVDAAVPGGAAARFGPQTCSRPLRQVPEIDRIWQTQAIENKKIKKLKIKIEIDSNWQTQRQFEQKNMKNYF